MSGVVKWFSKEKGYGFITTSEGKDIFVHYSDLILDGFKTLVDGQNVQFEIEIGSKGPKAKNVAVVPK